MTPYYDENGITIYHGDCRDFHTAVFDADLIVTDPPFNVGKDYGTATDDLADKDYRSMIRRLMSWGPERQAWVTPNKHWMMFAQALRIETPPIIVRRGAIGPIRLGWHDQYDMILVRGKPHKPFRNLWDDIRLRGEGYYFKEEWYDHPGYTPRAIFDRLIDLMAGPDDLILDPFCGTGTSLVAAAAAGRRAIGIEIEERYCKIAVDRLAQGVLEFS